MRPGGAARKWTDCWQGTIKGYEVEVKAGYNQALIAKGCDDEEGILEITAWVPGTHDEVYAIQADGGCGHNHIVGVSGTVITFSSGPFDLASVLPPATPTPDN